MGKLTSNKRITTTLPNINIRHLSTEDRIFGTYRIRHFFESKPVEHIIELAQSSCNYGGVRFWFKCEHCHNRAGILYLSEGKCACRKCSNLVYQSERNY